MIIFLHYNNFLILFINFLRQAFKLRQTEEQQKLEEMRRQKEEEMLQKRQEYVEKTKNALMFSDMPSEKKGKGKKVRTDQYVSDSGGSGGEERREEAPREKKRKRKSSNERKPRGKGRKRRTAGSGDSAAGNFVHKIIHQFHENQK